MANLMEKYPDTGMKHLYKHAIAKWVEQVNHGLFSELESIVEDEYLRDQNAGLTKAIYVLDPHMPFKGIDGGFYITKEEIAACLEKNFEHYKNDLLPQFNPFASFYLYFEARGYKKEADRFRDLFAALHPEAALNTIILFLQGDEVLIIGDFKISKPEELLELDDKTKAKIINDLANADSKVSLWLNKFSHLKDSIDKYRSLKRYDAITLRYALKEGFSLKGGVAKDREQFKNLFKSDDADNFDSYEATYWLKNYLNLSFNEIILELLPSDDYPSILLSYAFCNHDDAKLDIYQTMEKSLPIIKARTAEYMELLNNSAEIAAKGICWFFEHQISGVAINLRQSPDVCLKDFMQFVEKNKESFPEFFQELTSLLDDGFFAPIKDAVNQSKGDENVLKGFISTYHDAISMLMKINPQMPYGKRYEREKGLIDSRTKVIKEGIKEEKQEKTKIINDEYANLLARKKEEYKKDILKKKYNGKIIGSFVTSAIFLAFFLIGLSLDSTYHFKNFNDAMNKVGNYFMIPLVIIGALIGLGGGLAVQ